MDGSGLKSGGGEESSSSLSSSLSRDRAKEAGRVLTKDQYDMVFKCIIIGDTGTGKSCCLHQFVEGEFKSGPPKHTIGVEFGSRVIHIGGKYVKLQIWDTAGQERFRSVTRGYYRGAAGALVVYDITNRETFSHLENWIRDARSLAGPDVVLIVCGNKCDLKEERQVPLLEASRFAQENRAMFLETSALTGENVTEVFTLCAKTILTKLETGELALEGVSKPDDGKEVKLGANANQEGYCGAC